jgi:hypothetical protein
MSATGLEVFDTTVQKTNRWLNDAMGLLDIHRHVGAPKEARSAAHRIFRSQ